MRTKPESTSVSNKVVDRGYIPGFFTCFLSDDIFRLQINRNSAYPALVCSVM